MILELRADLELQARIDILAGKSNEGELTDQERADYEALVQAIHLIGMLQTKARMMSDPTPDVGDLNLRAGESAGRAGTFEGG